MNEHRTYKARRESFRRAAIVHLVFRLAHAHTIRTNENISENINKYHFYAVFDTFRN